MQNEVVAERLPHAQLAVLSGPTFAGEVARGAPTAITVAAHECGHALQHAGREPLFMWRSRLAVAGVWAARIGSFLLFAAPLLALLPLERVGDLLLRLAEVRGVDVAVLVDTDPFGARELPEPAAGLPGSTVVINAPALVPPRTTAMLFRFLVSALRMLWISMVSGTNSTGNRMLFRVLGFLNNS